MLSSGRSGYSVDHLVLPTPSIAAARQRLGKLGFTVAADALHPFGTENCCVFLADKTYLEPLGVADRAQATVAAKEGNVFTARDAAFRFRQGENGLSAVVLGSSNAEADDRRFRENGVSGGSLLEFGRVFELPDGTRSEARFRLAFASDLRAPDFFFFTCERLNALPADRGVLETHRNGVIGMREIIVSAHDPEAFRSFIETVFDHEAVPDPFGLTITAGNLDVTVIGDEGFQAHLDWSLPSPELGLVGRGVVFTVSDLSVTERHFAANGVTYTRMNNRILVKPAPGQGAHFAFEEAQ